MGNTLSREDGSENEDVQVQEKQPEFAAQNGSVALQNATLDEVTPSTDQVDGKQETQQKSIISSTEKTIVFSPISNGEIDSKPSAPTAQSKFRLSISRPPSGRTMLQVSGLEGEKIKTTVPSEEPLVIENQNDTPVVLETSVTKASNTEIQNQSLLSAIAINATTPPSEPAINEPPLAASVSNGLETPPKPKEISFFQRIFMAEKKVQFEEPQQPQLEENEEAGIIVEQNAGLQSIPLTNTSQAQVSPNKSTLKSEEESKKDSDDKSKKGDDLSSGNKVVEEQPVAVTINPEQPSPEQILTQDTKSSEPNVQPQISAPASKDEGKAAKESVPRPKPFWRKSFKGDPPATKQEENVEEEQPVAAVTINSVNAAPEQIGDQNINSAAPNVQIEIQSQPSGSDRKAEKETTPERPRPFWRKSFKGDPAVAKIQENSFKGDPQPVKNEENSLKEEPEAEAVTENASAEKEAKADAGVQAAASSGKGQESPDKGKKAEDGKNTKPKLMMFFKQLSLDLTDGAEATKSEKTVVSAVVEPPPPAPKIKENQKEKKAGAEKMTKQESKDMPEAVSPTQHQASDPALVQNGADATKDGQLKKTEKRQSLGNFFKAIGPKRLSDAAVQTDPVCILPGEKAK